MCSRIHRRQCHHGFNLEGVNTKLAIYYKDDNGDPGNTPTAQWDTLVTYFSFAANTSSASANYIVRDYTGTPLAASANGVNGSPDDLIYIQSTPGSFATIKIPGLAGLNNSVVHRAELIMEQVHDDKDTLFPPTNLYLDAYDPAAIAPKFRMIPYDVAFDGSGNSNFASSGIGGMNTKDPSGNSIRSWRFNLTRYVQHVVHDTEPVYDLRLSAPLVIKELYRPGTVGSTSSLIPFQFRSMPVAAKEGKMAGIRDRGTTRKDRLGCYLKFVATVIRLFGALSPFF